MTTDNTQELDEIIEHAYNAGYSAKDMVRQTLLDWHNKQVLEIIGEDEPPEGLTSWYDGIERDSRHREGRNMLREWQRNKLKKGK